MRESTFSFWEDADFNALRDEPLLPGEDAWHSGNVEKTYESWYIEAVLDKGYVLGVTFATKGLKKLPSPLEPQLKVDLVTPEGTRETLVQHFTKEDFRASEEYVSLEMGTNRFAGTFPEYRLQVTSSEVSLDLQFTAEVPGWKPGRGRVAYADKGKKFLQWVVPVPRASVAGNISVKGQKEEVSGLGYYHYLYTNFYLPEILSRTIWARVYTEDYTIIFADIVGRTLFSYEPVRPFMLAQNEVMKLSTGNMDLMTRGLQRDPQTGARYPREMVVKVAGEVPVEVRTKAKKMLWGRSVESSSRKPLLATVAVDAKVLLLTYPVSETAGQGVITSIVY
ncbi:hypothetical protein [Calderihabitans maritimus]|uniref:Uncharacterized protein n=1 Tax=Calderihabitans maritimus TaxID=1246530 RepID=A0A1Z5HXJ1_9FIRM|nr:hypothetical protein [Calderihabitans maritimus]GAW94242.1 hypothetical protein Moth_1148 [Calderihabitans maritimus]